MHKPESPRSDPPDEKAAQGVGRTDDAAASSLRDARPIQETLDYTPRPVEPAAARRPTGAASSAPAELPEAFGRYVVRGVLGRGGFGMVYLGHDTQLDRPVAIKLLRGGKDLPAEESERFLEEARRVARLRHPGIVTVHDVGVQDNQVYIVTDFIQGTTLREWLKKRRPTWQEATRITAAVADALGHAHARLTIHRDVKPANILVTEDLAPALVDFGLGLDESGAAGRELGAVSGTPTYMSPEQVTGEAHRIDGRTDIYSLGVVLYELLCARPPFRATATSELLRQVRDDEPQPPRQLVRDLPRDLERICLKALAKRINDRYTTAADFADELRSVLAKFASGTSAFPDSAGSVSLDSAVSNAAPPREPAASVPGLTPPMPSKELPSGQISGGSTASSVRRMRGAERRQVTILFCGCQTFQSEQYLESLDDEDQIEVLRGLQQMCDEAIRNYDGTVLQSGEDIVGCFGYPVAYEDAARRAARAALSILGGIAKLNKTLERRHKLTLTPWIGIHTGSAVTEMIAENTVSVVGEARNVAAGLGNVAEAGSIVCTEAVHRLIRGHFECESLGQHKIKGAAQPIAMHRVKAESRAIDVAPPIGLTPLTGRDHEVNLLKDRWEQAQEGMGQIVLLIGEAGLGKSRLVYTIKRHIEEERGMASASRRTPPLAATSANYPSAAGTVADMYSPIVGWRCSPHHQNSSLYLVVDFFERFLAFGRQEAPYDKFVKLVNHLEILGMAEPDIVPLLASVLSLPLDGRFPPLSLSPVRQRERTLEILHQWLRAYASRQPVLFVIEDLHWIDASSLEFLKLFVNQGLNDCVLTLLTFRPEFKTPWPAVAHQTSLALTRLTRRQVAEMMRKKTGIEHIPNAIVEHMVDRTSGVPLFVEEFTRMIQESGVLEQAADDSSWNRSFALHEIPATLQDLVMARLDRIDSDKEVIQLGATLGREFSHDLLAAVATLDEPTLLAELAKLVQAELLYQKGQPPKCTYTFKHALLEDASYSSMVKSTRQQFHKRIGEVLESRFPETVENEPELLAHHFSEAGETRKGVGYWLKAGLRARARSAEIEAIGHLAKGLELLETLDESLDRDELEMAFQAQIGTAYLTTRGYAAPELGPCFRRARDLCEKLAAAAEALPMTTEPVEPTEYLGGGLPTSAPDPTVRSPNLQSDSRASGAATQASRGQLQSQLFAVMWGRWAWHVVRGEFRLCMELAAEAMELADKLADPSITMEALFMPGLTMLYRADFSGARERCEKAVTEFDNRAHTKFWASHTGQNSSVTHRCYLSLAFWHLGFPDQALATNREMVEVARAVKHPFSLAYAMHHSGWLHQHCRLGVEAQAAGDEEIQIATEQGFAFWHATGTLYRAAGLLQQGQLEQALPLILKGLDDYRRTGAGLALPFYLSILGDAYTQAGRFDDALKTLEEGIVLADKTDDWFQYAELHRLKGDLALARSPADYMEAESLFLRATEIARSQKSRSFELRATLSLCQLWHRQGRHGDARRALAAIYGTFTEGFSTPDLLAAKSLLDELAAFPPA
jgi:serine/threonine protein kinase/predicted ATPase